VRATPRRSPTRPRLQQLALVVERLRLNQPLRQLIDVEERREPGIDGPAGRPPLRVRVDEAAVLDAVPGEAPLRLADGRRKKLERAPGDDVAVVNADVACFRAIKACAG